MHDARGHSIHAGAAVLRVHRDAEQAKITRAFEQGVIELLFAIMLKCLRQTCRVARAL